MEYLVSFSGQCGGIYFPFWNPTGGSDLYNELINRRFFLGTYVELTYSVFHRILDLKTECISILLLFYFIGMPECGYKDSQHHI